MSVSPTVAEGGREPLRNKNSGAEARVGQGNKTGLTNGCHPKHASNSQADGDLDCKENRQLPAEKNGSPMDDSAEATEPCGARNCTETPSYMAPTLSSQTKRRIISKEAQTFKPKRITPSRPRRPRKPNHSSSSVSGDSVISSTDGLTSVEKPAKEPPLQSVDEAQTGQLLEREDGRVTENGARTTVSNDSNQRKKKGHKSTFKDLICCVAPKFASYD